MFEIDASEIDNTSHEVSASTPKDFSTEVKTFYRNIAQKRLESDCSIPLSLLKQVTIAGQKLEDQYFSR